MKTRYYILLLLSLFLLPACSGWLDLQPELEMREKKMYETEDGFKDVLTGAYIRLAMPDLYGMNLSMGFIELMSQHWITSNNTTAHYIRNFNYEEKSVQDIITQIWFQYYQTIVNINALLAEIDRKESLFTNGNYNLIKGEALGLRAFIHFDVLRLWGDVPADIQNGDIAIPYVTHVTKNPNELRSTTYAQVLKNIIDDLDAAEKLLADDPIILFPNNLLNDPSIVTTMERPEDGFHYYRQNRFNYFAVKAIKARYYLWIDNKTEALKYAREVLDAVNPTDDSPKFWLGDDISAVNGNLIFTEENIFAVNNSNAYSTIKPLFIEEGGYTQTKSALDKVYEAVACPYDIRYRDERLWEERASNVQGGGDTYNFFKKYVMRQTVVIDVVPVVRLSEMCFIAAECGDMSYLETYRLKRNIVDTGSGPGEEIARILEMEYRKEFYGEGQMFFYYKRNKKEQFTLPTTYTMDPANYKLPKPQQQTQFE